MTFVLLSARGLPEDVRPGRFVVRLFLISDLYLAPFEGERLRLWARLVILARREPACLRASRAAVAGADVCILTRNVHRENHRFEDRYEGLEVGEVKPKGPVN